MIIRIEFKSDGSAAVEEARFTLGGSPSGTILDSSNSLRLGSSHYIQFHYLDPEIIDKYYSGTDNQIKALRKYPGVKSVDIIDVPHSRNMILESYSEFKEMLLRTYPYQDDI